MAIGASAPLVFINERSELMLCSIVRLGVLTAKLSASLIDRKVNKLYFMEVFSMNNENNKCESCAYYNGEGHCLLCNYYPMQDVVMDEIYEDLEYDEDGFLIE